MVSSSALAPSPVNLRCPVLAKATVFKAFIIDHVGDFSSTSIGSPRHALSGRLLKSAVSPCNIRLNAEWSSFTVVFFAGFFSSISVVKSLSSKTCSVRSTAGVTVLAIDFVTGLSAGAIGAGAAVGVDSYTFACASLSSLIAAL